MLTNQRNYDVKEIIEFGMVDKEAGKESVFIKFKTEVGHFTWFGSLKPKQPGKKIGARDVTFGTMTRLGWDGDIDKFVNNMPCFALPVGVTIEVADDEWEQGRVSKDKVTAVYVPGYGASKMDPNKARSVMSGMMADINRARSDAALKKDEPDF